MAHQSHSYQFNVTLFWLLVPFISVKGRFCKPLNLKYALTLFIF